MSYKTEEKTKEEEESDLFNCSYSQDVECPVSKFERRRYERRKNWHSRPKSIYEVEQRPSAIDYELSELKQTVSELKSDVRELVEAWNAVSWLLKFVKYVAALTASIFAVLEIFKNHGN